MSIDQRGRQAGSALRAAVSRDTDVERSLAELQRTLRRRQRTRVTASAAFAAAAAAVVVSLAVMSWQRVQDPADPPVADRPQVSSCSENAAVTCPEPERVRVTGPSVYEVTLPARFPLLRAAPRAPLLLDFYQRDREAGVTVIQDAVGVGARGPSVPAADLATWIASRPFLDASGPRRTALDRGTAWLVEARLAPRALRGGMHACNDTMPRCRALLRSRSDPNRWEVGPWDGMLSRFYLLDAPGSRVTVLWSWAFDDRRALGANAALVRTFTSSPPT